MDRPNNAVVDREDREHPAIVRLRSELDAARRGIADLDGVADEHRERIVASVRTGVPDVAGRAAFEVGAEAAIEEIRRFAAPDLVNASAEGTRLWQEIVATAAEAARAARA